MEQNQCRREGRLSTLKHSWDFFFFFFEEISFNESLKLASSGEMTQQKRYSKDISSGKASKLGSGEKNIKKRKEKETSDISTPFPSALVTMMSFSPDAEGSKKLHLYDISVKGKGNIYFRFSLCSPVISEWSDLVNIHFYVCS